MRRMVYESRMIAHAAAELEPLLLGNTPQLLATAAGSTLFQDPTSVDGSFSIDLPTHLAGVDLAKRVRVTTGVARHLQGRVLLPLSWQGDPGRHLFPSFEGTLEIGALYDDVAEVVLAGSYRVPLGLLGAAMETTVLHAAARDTAARLIQALAEALSEAAVAVPNGQPSSVLPPSEAVLHVRDVMSSDPYVLPAETGLRAAAHLLLSVGVSAVPVIAEDGGLLGVLSEHDLLAKEATQRFGLGHEAHEEETRRLARTAGEACSHPARVTTPDARLADATRAMLDQHVNRLIVIDDGAIVGTLTRHDVLRALVRATEDIETAVRRALDALDASHVDATIDSKGEVDLRGVVELRSVAARVPDAVAAIEGVIGVHADHLRYRVDDVLPSMPLT